MKNLTFFPAFLLKAKYPALFSIFLVFAFSAKAQIKADFNSSATAGCAPLIVNFSDSSTGNPTSWKWDLGNGTTSVLPNPSVVYFDPGTYTVKLIIRNTFGVDSITKVQYITVYSSPVINFDASALTGCFPLKTQFSDLSLPGSGVLKTLKWDFGDGNFSEEQNPEHVYNATGNFNVSLRAVNNFGCVTSKTVASFIHINTGVKADFSNSTSKSCNAPATINFTGKSTGVGPLNYFWNFGDDSTSTAANPSHTYNASGSYTVSLTVSNATGCSDTLIKKNLIIIGSTNADFSIPDVVCEGAPVILKNTSSPVPSAATWNFSDGTFSDAINAIKVFNKAGEFKITMVSNNGACKDSVTKNIKVVAKPLISFSASDSVSCKMPLNVKFNNTSTGVNSRQTGTSTPTNTYYWDFGDGNNSNAQSPAHTYTAEGNYTVKLFVTNDGGCTDSLIKTNLIRIKKPVVSINNLPQKGCGPLLHKFTSTVNSIDSITGFHWDFGDGNSSDSITPTHIYNKPGKYSITLTYTTEGGCTGNVSVQNGIIVGSKPQTKYISNLTNVCAVQKINFTDQSVGNPDQWIWFFGDGGSSGAQNPLYQYNDTGYFSVTLISINNGCADTLTIPKMVHVNPPVARFSFAKTCTVPRQIIFSDLSIGADSWNWDFGDGTTSTEKNPAHNYSTPGDYTVSLTVTNQLTGCSQTKTETIKIIREIADFTVSSQETCRNTPVSFSTSNINAANISLYTWKFGDGISISDTGKSAVHKYSKASGYNVTLYIKDVNGCIDSVTKPLAVQVNGPTAVFRSSVPGTCLNSSVNFFDSSYSDGTHAIQQWQWNWGDGKTDNLNAGPFNHTYSTPGSYTVSLIVTDNKGCTDKVTKPNIILVSKPIAAFTTDTLSCTSKPINITNLSSGPGLIYNWDFGDGTTSNQVKPVHLYNTEGNYTISLSIKDQYGCTSSVSKTNSITIANPASDFQLSDSVGTCPPLVVTFTNTSENYSKWSWDFGDGNTSSERNPSHFYAEAGVFNAVLTITGPGGCISQKTRQIKVDGPSGTFSYTNMMGCAPVETGFKAQTKKNTSFVWDFNDGTTISTKDSNVVHTYNTPGKYLPKMILKDAKGCQVAVKGSDSILVLGVTASFNHNGALVCDSTPVTFTNTSISNDAIVKYVWNFGDGTTSSDALPLHSYHQPGSYTTSLEVTTQRGCIDSVRNTHAVKVNRSPQISISSGEGACVPALINFTGILSNPDTSKVSWKWDFANGHTSTLQKPLGQNYLTAGNFTVKAIGYSSNGCNDTATKIIEIYPLPNLAIYADTVVCLGSSQGLKVTGAETYSWSPANYLSCTNCASPVTTPTTAVKYQVKGTSNKGCVSRDSISLTVKFPFKLSLSKADTLCFGESTQLKASGTETYSWTPSRGLNNPLIAAPKATPAETTTYQVIGSDSKGCFKDTGYIPVKVYPIPTVNAGDDKNISVGREVQIVPEISKDVTSVTWSPSTAIISNEGRSITVKPVQSLEYTIRVKNDGGCSAEDKISVYVLCNNSNVFVPNTFSPNGDGANDIFYPRGSGVFKIQNLKVFNRWGEVVFEKSNFNPNDASAGWNGTFRGKPLPPDVFVYILQVVCDNNTSLTFKGNIALIK
ncbi:MAG: PKD domain-containing protein [Ginsengibacter sp.]